MTSSSSRSPTPIELWQRAPSAKSFSSQPQRFAPGICLQSWAIQLWKSSHIVAGQSPRFDPSIFASVLFVSRENEQEKPKQFTKDPPFTGSSNSLPISMACSIGASGKNRTTKSNLFQAHCLVAEKIEVKFDKSPISENLWQWIATGSDFNRVGHGSFREHSQVHLWLPGRYCVREFRLALWGKQLLLYCIYVYQCMCVYIYVYICTKTSV